MSKSSFFTKSRKITLARLAGISAGAGLMQALTKEAAVVFPAVGVALVGAAILHRRMDNDKIADTEATPKALCRVAAEAAGEVALVTTMACVAKNAISGFRKAPVDPTLVDAAPAVDVAPVDVTPVV